MIGHGKFRYTDGELKTILSSAVVLTDTREQCNEHILTAFDTLKVAHRPMALSFGDYLVMLPANPGAGIIRDLYFEGDIMIERKANLDELAVFFFGVSGLRLL